MFALGVQTSLFLATAVPYLFRHSDAGKDITKRVIATLTAALPIAIPTVMVCSNIACARKLRAKAIHVLDAGKLKAAADVSICCFDKTGTLTECGELLPFRCLSKTRCHNPELHTPSLVARCSLTLLWPLRGLLLNCTCYIISCILYHCMYSTVCWFDSPTPRNGVTNTLQDNL